MSSPFSYMLVIFFFMVVGLGGLFLTTSALCGNETGQCNGLVSVGDFGYPWADNDYWDCGYPGLTFSRSYVGDLRSILVVSNDLYYILSKDEQNQRLRVVQVDVEEEECPRPMHNFTLPTASPFSDPDKNPDNKYNITYFYNCSSGYPKDVVQELPCLDTYYNNNTTPGLRSFAFFTLYGYSADDRFNWYTRNCQKKVVVSAIRIYNFSDIKESLKRGFYLEWSAPEECKDSEKSGGQCWFNQTTATVHHHACSCPQHGTDQRKLFDKVCPIQGSSHQGDDLTGVSEGQIISSGLKIRWGERSGAQSLTALTSSSEK